MAIDKIITTQRDFSGGQIDPDGKRRDDLDLMRAGGRQMRNVRPKSIGSAKNRPGRRAIHSSTAWRDDFVRMTPTAKFKLGFSAGKITIYNEDGTVEASSTDATYIWTNDNLDDICWTQAGFDIIICFPEMQPQIARWDRVTETWSFLDFAFRVNGNISREPFYRFGDLGATMQASARTGSITLTCSVAFFDVSMIGQKLSWGGQQVTITAVSSATVATATVADMLPALILWGSSGYTPEGFNIGDIVVGTQTGRKSEVIYINAVGKQLSAILIDSVSYYGLSTSALSDTLVSANTQWSVTGSLEDTSNWASRTVATVRWQEQFMGAVRGWPSRCAFAQNRLVFYDFPQAPEAILFSAIGQYDTFWVDATAVSNSQSAGASPSSAILEFVPSRKGKARVRHVVDIGDILVFTDKGIWQIPVSVSNPLKPGSLQFVDISSDAVSKITPVSSQELVFYINEGLNRVSVIRATGAATRSYSAEDISGAHGGLIVDPVTMALASGDDKHPERLLYVVNADGSVAVGRQVNLGERTGFGWFPWSGTATTRWVTVADKEVFFVDEYDGNYIVSLQDDDYWLDGAVLLNDIPAGMAPSGGLGDLWWLAEQTVTLMIGRRDLGDRQVDANGDLVPADDDDLLDPDLVVGTKWTLTVEPFVPNVQAGQSRKQRQRMRRVPKMAVSVVDSTGFECQGREISPYSYDDDTTADPPLREQTYLFTSNGRYFDPRAPITKTRPGPLTIVEISFEGTV